MRKYGFCPSSTEYILKYDDVEKLQSSISVNQKDFMAKWSPFEWSIKPKSFDLLSFTGHFGSIKCFKHLLLNGFSINDSTLESVIYSGNSDLFRLCYDNGINSFSSLVTTAAQFCRLSLLKFFVQNGAEIDATDLNI